MVTTSQLSGGPKVNYSTLGTWTGQAAEMRRNLPFRPCHIRVRLRRMPDFRFISFLGVGVFLYQGLALYSRRLTK